MVLVHTLHICWMHVSMISDMIPVYLPYLYLLLTYVLPITVDILELGNRDPGDAAGAW